MSTVLGSGKTTSTIYEWGIQNYTSHCNDMEVGNHLSSPAFSFCNKLWHLEIYPKGNIARREQDSENHVSLFLCSDDDSIIELRFGFLILDSKKNILVQTPTEPFRIFEGRHDWGIPKVIKCSSMMVTTAQNIRVVCEMISKSYVVDNSLFKSTCIKHQYFKGFENYLSNTQFSDIKLIIEDKEILAHKMVLAANSGVFAAMFNHEMRENKENTIIIQDIKYEVFYELLRYMYTGESCLTESITSELLKASDKYDLLKLKNICEEELCKNLSTSNVIECLHLADTYNAQILKEEAIDFFTSHGQEIIDQPEFDSLRNLNSEIFIDVFRSVFARSD